MNTLFRVRETRIRRDKAASNYPVNCFFVQYMLYGVPQEKKEE